MTRKWSVPWSSGAGFVIGILEVLLDHWGDIIANRSPTWTAVYFIAGGIIGIVLGAIVALVHNR